MITIANQSGPNLFINLSSKILHKDYEEVLAPVISSIVSHHDTVNVCAIFDENLNGAEILTIIDDAKLGIKYWRHWNKIALVSEPKWLNSMIQMFEFMSPAAIECFSDIKEVQQWFQEEDYF